MGVINTDADVSLNATFAPTPAAPRLGRLRQPVGRARRRDPQRRRAARHRPHPVRLDGQQGRRLRQRSARVLGERPGDPGDPACTSSRSATRAASPRSPSGSARKKPILIVKSGRTAEGARAASSHTGALAGADVTVSAFLEQCGVLRANTIEELFDVARALDRCPLPAGQPGGDRHQRRRPRRSWRPTPASTSGSRWPSSPPATRADLASFLPAAASLGNPVDMIASATAEQYERTVAAVLDDPGVDIGASWSTSRRCSPTRATSSKRQVGGRLRPRAKRHRGKPVLAVMMATEDFYEGLKGATRPAAGLPLSRVGGARPRAAACATPRGAGGPRTSEPPSFAVDDAAIARGARAGRRRRLPRRRTTPSALLEALRHPGRAVAQVRGLAPRRSPPRGEIGYPVVVKAIAPGLVHKSEAKAVVLDLANEAELGARLRRRCAPRLGGAGTQLERLPGPGDGARRARDDLRHLDRSALRPGADVRARRQVRRGLPRRRFGVTPLAPSEAREMVARHPRRPAPRRRARRGAAPTGRCSRRCCCGSPSWSQNFPRSSSSTSTRSSRPPRRQRVEPAASKAVDVRVRVYRPAAYIYHAGQGARRARTQQAVTIGSRLATEDPLTALNDPNLLGEIPLFHGIPADRLKRLNEVLHKKTVPAGTNMITAEQPGEVVYVLLEGTVKILIEQMDGREVILAFLGAGDTVGEMSLVDSAGRSANVMTMEKCTFLWMDRATFSGSASRTSPSSRRTWCACSPGGCGWPTSRSSRSPRSTSPGGSRASSSPSPSATAARGGGRRTRRSRCASPRPTSPSSSAPRASGSTR